MEGRIDDDSRPLQTGDKIVLSNNIQEVVAQSREGTHALHRTIQRLSDNMLYEETLMWQGIRDVYPQLEYFHLRFIDERTIQLVGPKNPSETDAPTI
jgi:hypothetical protein